MDYLTLSVKVVQAHQNLKNTLEGKLRDLNIKYVLLGDKHSKHSVGKVQYES